MKNNISIVIIDSGIYIDDKPNDYQGVHIFINSDTIAFDNNIKDEIGHGTAVYNIINKHLNSASKINYYFIKIFDKNTLQVDEELLIRALNYIYDNLDCDIINASLGISITNNDGELSRVCEKLRGKGTIIISAFDNMGTVSFPAALKNVIGVTTGDNIYNQNEYYYVEDDIVNICAFGNTQRVVWLNNRIILSGGDSFACAHFSGIIAKLLVERDTYFSIDQIMEIIKRNSSAIIFPNCSKNLNIEKFVPKIRNAAIFPFSKEAHSLLRFRHLLSFNIQSVYDLPKSGRVGMNINRLLNIEGDDILVKNINDIDYSEIDTLILGHTYEMSSSKTGFQINKLLDSASNNNINIYSYDDLSIIYPENKSIINKCKIFTPSIGHFDNEYIPFGKLYKHSKPILGIFGTGAKQGKFTLQLTLRDMFLKGGYDIGQIGSEPSSYLFGMDYCLPFGHDSTINMSSKQVIQFINRCLFDLCEKNVDIILCGSQSGTVTFDFGNINNYPLNQIDFLLAANPDAVILCVNPFDDLRLIERTINFIESCTESKVLALCMFPMDWQNPDLGVYSTLMKISLKKFTELKKLLVKRFKKDVYLLGYDSDMTKLFNTIVDFFSN